MGVVSQLGLGLAKTREGMLGSLRRLLPGGRKLTPELYEALEGALLAADVGVAAATALMDAVRGLVWQSGEADADSVRAVLKKVMIDRLRTDGKAETILNAPHVILLAGVTGVILTKLDGTAKGGIVLAVTGELGLPVRYIGVGEGVEDLQAFEPEAFVDALLGES